MMMMMMMLMIIIIILDFEKIRPNLWHQILRFISSYFQRNSAIFSAFYSITLKTESLSLSQNVPALVWAWGNTLFGHMVGPTRRSPPVGISIGCPPPASPCWLNYSQHRWRETRLCKSPADLNREKTFPACGDSTDSKHDFTVHFMLGKHGSDGT